MIGLPIYFSSLSMLWYIPLNSNPVSQNRIMSTGIPSSNIRRSIAVESLLPERDTTCNVGSFVRVDTQKIVNENGNYD